MKKLAILLAIGLMLCGLSTANATLIGINLPGYPDIEIDSTSVVTYDAVNDIFTITALDKTIAFSSNPADQYTLFPNVSFSLTIKVDSFGNLIPDQAIDMFETVTKSFTLGGHLFQVGDVLLQGNVFAFGWELNSTSPYSSFDFLLDNVTGGLIGAGLWPQLDIGIVAFGAGHKGITGTLDWEHSWTLEGGKIDKAPVPEPATMLLLGSGLAGVGIFAKRKFGKKS